MPSGNRKGPAGQGPGTGRGRGFCSGSGEPGFHRHGEGCGRGEGRRLGLGCGRLGEVPVAEFASGHEEDLPFLQRHAARLQAALENTRKCIERLTGEARHPDEDSGGGRVPRGGRGE